MAVRGINTLWKQDINLLVVMIIFWKVDIMIWEVDIITQSRLFKQLCWLLRCYVNLSDNAVDLSDNDVDLSDLYGYVDLSDHYIDLSEKYFDLSDNDVDLSDIKLTRRWQLVSSTGYENKIFSY